MEPCFHKKSQKVCGLPGTLSMAALGMMLLAGPGRCDDPFSMAPPIQSAATQYVDGAAGNVSPDSVFNWSEVPLNQRVPVQRAVFDRGGYQIYDTVGETIIVPFTNQNLYVMKFGQSTDGTMYFVNEGNAPVLYVPEDGYLENATVPGARWFPFSQSFHPSQPVFLGIAPSWDVFVGMGWYPDMYYHGGYWCEQPFLSGGIFLPSFGLFFEIGGRHYDGWDRYHDYYERHPAPYHERVENNYFYERANHPEWGGRPFEGGGHREGGYHSEGDHSFGQGRVYQGGRTIGGDHGYVAHRTFQGGIRTLGSDHSYGAGRNDQTPHSFGQGRTYPSGHTFNGGQPGEGYHPTSGGSDHSFGGGNRTYGGEQPSNGGRTFGGIRPSASSGSPSYSNRGSSPSSGRSYGGGNNSPSHSSGNVRASSGNSQPGGNGGGIGSGDRRR